MSRREIGAVVLFVVGCAVVGELSRVVETHLERLGALRELVWALDRQVRALQQAPAAENARPVELEG